MSLEGQVASEPGLVTVTLHDTEGNRSWVAQLWPEGAEALAADLITHAAAARAKVELGIRALAADVNHGDSGG